MTLHETSLRVCAIAITCGTCLIGCLGEEGLDDGSTPNIGQASQALIDTRTLENEAGSAQATCTVLTFGVVIADDGAQIECDISDTANDDHSVYVDWTLDGFAPVRLSNDEGAGSTIFAIDARQNFDARFQEIRWKVCTDVQFFDDDCSNTVLYEL